MLVVKIRSPARRRATKNLRRVNAARAVKARHFIVVLSRLAGQWRRLEKAG